MKQFGCCFLGDLLRLFNVGPHTSTGDVMVTVPAVSNTQHESAGHERLNRELKQLSVILGFACYHAALSALPVASRLKMKVAYYRLKLLST